VAHRQVAQAVVLGDARCLALDGNGVWVLGEFPIRREAPQGGLALVTVSTGCSVRVRARWCSSCHVRSCSSVSQSFMAMLIAFSWRFLLILGPERARRVSWGVAPNPVN
jgi:hypothetical protein